jgi:hypothetical protein
LLLGYKGKETPDYLLALLGYGGNPSMSFGVVRMKGEEKLILSSAVTRIRWKTQTVLAGEVREVFQLEIEERRKKRMMVGWTGDRKNIHEKEEK